MYYTVGYLLIIYILKLENLKGRDIWLDVGLDMRIILKWILNRMCGLDFSNSELEPMTGSC
jgi:hypothetical protein